MEQAHRCAVNVCYKEQPETQPRYQVMGQLGVSARRLSSGQTCRGAFSEWGPEARVRLAPEDTNTGQKQMLGESFSYSTIMLK